MNAPNFHDEHPSPFLFFFPFFLITFTLCMYVLSLYKLNTPFTLETCVLHVCACLITSNQLGRLLIMLRVSFSIAEQKRSEKEKAKFTREKAPMLFHEIDIFISSALMRFPFNRKLFPPHDFFGSFLPRKFKNPGIAVVDRPYNLLRLYFNIIYKRETSNG